MTITYIGTEAITEQSYPLESVGPLTRTQVGVIAAQIASRVEKSKKLTESVEVTGGWTQNGDSGECWVNQFEVAGVCVKKLNGTWIGGNTNFGGSWSVTNGTQAITGAWINNNQGESWDILVSLSSTNGLTASGTLTTTTEYTFSGTIAATNVGVQTVSPSSGIGKYGLTTEQLEAAGYLKAGTSDLVNSGSTTVCELHNLLSEISLWNCRQSLESFLDSDQTPALVDVMQNTLDDLIADEKVDCESTPAEVAAEILKAMYPEENPTQLEQDAAYAIAYVENNSIVVNDVPDVPNREPECDWIPTLTSEQTLTPLTPTAPTVTTKQVQNNLLDNLFNHRTPILRDTPKTTTDTYLPALQDDMAAILGGPIPPANYTNKPAEKAGKC